MTRIEKLIEIRDNLHKKTYVKNLFGDYDLEKLMEVVINLTHSLDRTKKPEEFHKLFLE